jgi:mono/diheme cytochrome c family protein
MKLDGQVASATASLVLVVVALMCGSQRSSAQQGKTQWDGVYSEAQANRGRAIYSDVCAVCHSSNLYGTELAPALTSAALIVRWGNRPLADLFEYTQVFMPFNSPGGLTRQQNADILAFILQQARFPAGRADLPAQADDLKQIMLAPAKP